MLRNYRTEFSNADAFRAFCEGFLSAFDPFGVISRERRTPPKVLSVNERFALAWQKTGDALRKSMDDFESSLPHTLAGSTDDE